MKASTEPNRIVIAVTPHVDIAYDRQFNTVELIRREDGDVLKTKSVPENFTARNFMVEVENAKKIFSGTGK